jgi:hypothetical protein
MMTNDSTIVLQQTQKDFSVGMKAQIGLRADDSTIIVQRSEKKFFIGPEDRLRLLEAFNLLLTPDVNGGKFGYTVRSIYFDSIRNTDYYNKIYKAGERKTIRIRTYNSNSTSVKFEIKYKRGEHQVKKSVAITKEDALAMLDLDFSVLQKYNNPTARYGHEVMTAGLYRPVSFIQYDRRAFTHRDFNTRITLDNNILYSNQSFDLFQPKLNFCTPIMTNNSVLEVKYEKYLLPYLQDIILSCEHLGKPVSKFGTSRNIVKRYYC